MTTLVDVRKQLATEGFTALGSADFADLDYHFWVHPQTFELAEGFQWQDEFRLTRRHSSYQGALSLMAVILGDDARTTNYDELHGRAQRRLAALGIAGQQPEGEVT